MRNHLLKTIPDLNNGIKIACIIDESRVLGHKHLLAQLVLLSTDKATVFNYTIRTKNTDKSAGESGLGNY